MMANGREVLREHLGGCLRKIRLDAGYTQQQIGDRADMEQRTIDRLEKGEQRIYLDQLLDFERACGVPAGRSLRLAGLISDPRTAEQALMHDATITETWRRVLLTSYRMAISESDGSASR